jgi:hypothetical protein
VLKSYLSLTYISIHAYIKILPEIHGHTSCPAQILTKNEALGKTMPPRVTHTIFIVSAIDPRFV